MVVGVDEPGDLPAGLVLGLEVLPGQQFHSRVELKLSCCPVLLVERRADPAHRLGDPQRRTGPGEKVTDVLASLVGVEHDPGHLAASDGGGHAQRRLGERRVVVLAHREARQSAEARSSTVAR